MIASTENSPGPRKSQCAMREYESGLMHCTPRGQISTVCSLPAHSRSIRLPVPAHVIAAGRRQVPGAIEIVQLFLQRLIAPWISQSDTRICPKPAPQQKTRNNKKPDAFDISTPVSCVFD